MLDDEDETEEPESEQAFWTARYVEPNETNSNTTSTVVVFEREDTYVISLFIRVAMAIFFVAVLKTILFGW